MNTATEAELEKPGTLPEMNEYRLSVAATRHPGYIEWIVLPIGRTFAGGKIMSGSGTASSLSSLTIAFSSTSAPRGPTTLIIATPSGASGAVFSGTGLTLMYGGCSVQSESSTLRMRLASTSVSALRFSPALDWAMQYGRNTSLTCRTYLSSCAWSTIRLNSGVTASSFFGLGLVVFRARASL